MLSPVSAPVSVTNTRFFNVPHGVVSTVISNVLSETSEIFPA